MNARILFRPVCSNCHKEIREPIDYYIDDGGSGKIIIDGFMRMVGNSFIVKPCKCPHCDCYFEGIEIPGLPFDNTACD